MGQSDARVGKRLGATGIGGRGAETSTPAAVWPAPTARHPRSSPQGRGRVRRSGIDSLASARKCLPCRPDSNLQPDPVSDSEPAGRSLLAVDVGTGHPASVQAAARDRATVADQPIGRLFERQGDEPE